jgi:hypothetical protein
MVGTNRRERERVLDNVHVDSTVVVRFSSSSIAPVCILACYYRLANSAITYTSTLY